MPDIFQEGLSFVEGLAAKIIGLNPASADAVNSAKSTLQTEAGNAEASIEQTIDATVDKAINVIVGEIPIVGPLLEGTADSIANSVINSLIGKLGAKFGVTATPAAAAPAPQVTMEPVPNP